MKFLSKLVLAITIVGAATKSASAAADACRLTGSGYGYVKVVDGGVSWTYVVKSGGPRWQVGSYGYHASGALTCEACPAFGLFNLIGQSNLAEVPSEFHPPTTAAARAERRAESFGYPYMTLGPSDLEHRSSRENVAIGPISGYAVWYRVANPRMPDSNALLVISLTDGCVLFETSIGTKLGERENEVEVLTVLLREVSIKRTRSEEAELPKLPPRKKPVQPKRELSPPPIKLLPP